MERRAVILFLIKLFPAFFLTIFLWQYLGVSAYYHRLISAVMNLIYPPVDPTGLVDSIVARGNDIVVRFVMNGKHRALALTAEDISASNTTTLIALFLASPIKPFRALYLKCFLGSIATLFVIHLFTVVSTVVFAFASNPETAAPFSKLRVVVAFMVYYTNFYELIGMFLFVLVLWFLYIALYISRLRSRSKKKHPQTGASPTKPLTTG